MADTVKSADTVTLGFEREDGGTQKIDIPFGNTNIDDAEARAVMEHLTSNQILVDSKTGDVLSSTSILTAYITEGTYVDLDLTE